jgi:hypothetical protein
MNAKTATTIVFPGAPLPKNLGAGICRPPDYLSKRCGRCTVSYHDGAHKRASISALKAHLFSPGWFKAMSPL